MKDLRAEWSVFPGFELSLMKNGFDLPVNLAFAANSEKNSDAPLLYLTELYGQIKVITQDWRVHTFADNLLNYEPKKPFLPGMGESGVTGICIEPKTGDIFSLKFI